MAIRDFVYQGSPQRVVFGSGTLARLPDELSRLGIKRALVLSTAGHKSEAERVASLIRPASVGVFADARMHTPAEVTEAAMRVADVERPEPAGSVLPGPDYAN